jgi:isoleucyl-tRNA synthetase
MDFKSTLNLPHTNFPMKANLPKREVEILKRWKEMDLYNVIKGENEEKPKFILHDGPPYANGHIHIGHALNKILKDVIIKSKTMSGYSAEYIPGWDCHGLPIEHEVDKKLGSKKYEKSTEEIRNLCREYAKKFINIQRDEFKRLGVLGDWENPYLTFDFSYVATIVREFGNICKKGNLYKRKKPILWCHKCKTALAEAEVEYMEHISPSIYVKFPVTSDLSSILPSLKGKDIYVIIWTTTPWTIPANLAIALNPDFDYVAVEVENHVFILAEYLLSSTMEKIGVNDYKILEKFQGVILDGKKCLHPLYNRDSLIILGDHVTLDAGTGCVHTAPGHGYEDYEVALKYNLDIYAPVDESGNFLTDVEFFGGQNVFNANNEVNKKIAKNGMLLNEEEINHSYPHCWRCKNPVIFRATEQWFISIDKNNLRESALNKVNEVNWIPKWGKERIYKMIEHRPDWCISRQRSWGVPIIIFYCCSCNKVIIDQEIVNNVAHLFEKQGSDIWFTKEANDLLPEGFSCPSCGSTEFRKETDILDVWFDSGVSYASVLEKRHGLKFPADLYLEGSDQHRGWFQSALLTSVITRDTPPYHSVLTHGFVVDGEGKKMSKTVGNVIAPEEVIKRYGAEILRLWVVAEDYRDDVRISQEILKRLTEAYRRIRNTCRFLLGNLSDFDIEKDSIKKDELKSIDRFILHKLQILNSKIRKAYENFEFYSIFHALHNFCAVDLSSFYLDILKDRLYVSAHNSSLRRSAQTAIYHILNDMVRLMTPILSFTAEEIWDYLPKREELEDSIHLSHFPEVNDYFIDQNLKDEWNELLEVRNKVNKELENTRNLKLIGSSLEAKVELSAPQEKFELLNKYREELPSIFIVSFVSIEEKIEEKEVKVKVERFKGVKCERCWNYYKEKDRDLKYKDVCPRCRKVLQEINGNG